VSRWQPSDELVNLARTHGAEMSDLDRTWVVVCLTREGWTNAKIADQLDCSVRLIQNIRSRSQHAEYAYELRERLAR
jgi:DNA-binding NarL/FixJ family response regulator